MSLYAGDSPDNPNGHVDNPILSANGASRLNRGAFFEAIGAAFGVRKEGGGATYVGLAVCIAAVVAAGVWWIFLRRKRRGR